MKVFETSSSYPMISFEEAWEIIETNVNPLEPKNVPLDDLLGVVLAEPVVAQENVPPFRASTMDGYAVIADDDSTRLRVVGEQEAGRVLGLKLQPGTCVRIMTGAPLPAGADAVLPVEETQEQEGWMIPQAGVCPGQNVRPVGSDLSEGQQVLPDDMVLGPAEIGLLATLGINRPLVYPRPRVAVLATGDELVGQDEELQAGQIRDSNSFMLAAAIRSIGCEAVRIPRIADTKNALRDALEQAVGQADLVLSSGGVSMGTRDLVKPVLEEMGTVHFGRVAVKPGKPLTFATVQGVPVIGLPGNPVSSLVGFEVIVRPVLRIMANIRAYGRPEIEARLKHAIRHEADRLEFQRAVVSLQEGLWWAATTGSQASSRLMSLVGANALLRIPRGTGNLPAGARVRAMLIENPDVVESES